MKKNENKALKLEELKAKYGDTLVMGISESLVSPILKKIFTHKEDATVTSQQENITLTTPLLSVINKNLVPMLRYEAELDPSFKQIIPYVVLYHDDEIFCTHRLNGGDARLAGGYSIGTGGHIDNGEDMFDGMRRELLEEVGLKQDDIIGYGINGFILDNSSAVNSVHLGVVISMKINRSDIQCLETEKLSGEWVDAKKLKKLYDSDKLESWSKIVVDHVIFPKGDKNAKRKEKEEKNS